MVRRGPDGALPPASEVRTVKSEPTHLPSVHIAKDQLRLVVATRGNPTQVRDGRKNGTAVGKRDFCPLEANTGSFDGLVGDREDKLFWSSCLIVPDHLVHRWYVEIGPSGFDVESKPQFDFVAPGVSRKRTRRRDGVAVTAKRRYLGFDVSKRSSGVPLSNG